jgi:glucoamylase
MDTHSHQRMKGPAMRTSLLCLTATLTLAAAALAAVPASAAAPAPVSATDGPGALSHFDLARKDCLGTARNTTSKIWYTVADGVLSDVYAPTIDTTNVETMQYLVSDGSTFTDLQSRDTTYTVSTDPSGMMCTVTSTARSGKYRLTTSYLTDVDRSSVVMRTRYTPLTSAARNFHLYVRLDATVGGNGGGGSGSGGTADNGGADSAVTDLTTGSPVPVSFDTVTTTNAVNRDYAVPSYLALRALHGFSTVSSGFVGTPSDGLTQLDATHALAPVTASASDGNVEQTAELALPRQHGRPSDADSHWHDGADVVLALGFGTNQAAAVATAGASLAAPFDRLSARYRAGWQRYDDTLRRPASRLPGLSAAQSRNAARQYYAAANAVKASEDKTFAGAIVASLASPWGQAVSAGDSNSSYFGSYREVFSRDLYEAWTALLTDGDVGTARDATRFLFLRQQLADGSMPRNSLVNGKTAPDSFNTQLDEVAFPILMAYESGLSGDRTLWPHVRAAADFLISHGPSFGPERWEEQGGYSPSTIAAEIAGLVAAAHVALVQHDPASARVWLATADSYQRQVKAWTITTNGPLSSQPYFIRLSKTGDPNAAISYSIGNGGPTLDQRGVIDAGFLELVRLGELSGGDPDVQRSLAVVDSTIERTTASGPGWLRYNGDGYGDCHPSPAGACQVDGAPWAPSGKGTGHPWPVLTAERAEQDLATGQGVTAGSLLATMINETSGSGLVPEQVWDGPDLAPSPAGSDPTTASIGFVNGKPDGSAAPLTWGSASLVRLTGDLTAGREVETPDLTTDRYVRRAQPATTLTVTAPADQTPATGTIAVTGTAAPGARVDVADVASDQQSNTVLASTQAGPTGSFSVDVTVQDGTNVLVVTATAPGGGTAQAVRTVVDDVVHGTKLLDVSDPTGDDNGPGNYAYPTAADFHPGAYDLQDFQVYDTGSTVTFRVQTRDLSPTFGSPLGAQLVDVYVHNPAAAAGTTSTAAAFPSRNYQIAAPDAWNRLLEVQGFGQRFVDSSGATVGTISISANAISRYLTFSVDKTALGGVPASGWSFAVTLTGQDGFSPDQARAFGATPGPYNFGVCAAASSDPHCTVAPASVPKVMDTLTPPGVSQADELDYTRHNPVVIQGVAIP